MAEIHITHCGPGSLISIRGTYVEFSKMLEATALEDEQFATGMVSATYFYLKKKGLDFNTLTQNAEKMSRFKP